MRRPGQHAVIATFSPADDRTRAALRRGKPVSSVVRFTHTEMAPTSLLMDAYRPDDNLVRIELLVHPEQTKQLPQGIGFELVAGNALLGSGTILSRSIRQIAGVSSGYGDFGRGEMNRVARLYHLLQNRENLRKFLQLTGVPKVEAIVEDEFGIFLEYAYLRDMWERLKDEEDGNEKKKEIIVGCIGAVLPDSISQFSVMAFNEYFGACNRSRKPSKDYIESPHNWQLHTETLKKIDNDGFLDLCKFKWSFGARPDMVIHISNDAAVCIEAKAESKESSYPQGGRLQQVFKEKNISCRVSQTELQKHLMTDLLGLRTHFVYVTERGSRPKSTGYTPIRWKDIFRALHQSG